MEQEETIVYIYVADGCTGFAICAHVWQLIVLAESLAVAGSTNTTGDIEFLAHDIVPDAVDGVDIGGVAGEGGYIGHSRIHIGGAHCVTHCLVLLQYRLVALRVFCLDLCLPTIVEEELCLIKIFLVSCDQIELAECHFGNLMARNHACLSWVRPHLSNHAVGVADGDVEELPASCSLPVSHGTFNHVAQIIQFMAQIFFHAPSLVACPEVRMFRVLCTGGIEVAIGFLCRSDDIEHAVDVSLQLLVWVSLQHIACTLDSFVRVCVVEAQRHQFTHIVFVARMRCTLKVLVSSLGFAFAESQGDGYLAGGFDALPPESIVPYFYRCKGHGGDRIPHRALFRLLCRGWHQCQCCQGRCN